MSEKTTNTRSLLNNRHLRIVISFVLIAIGVVLLPSGHGKHVTSGSVSVQAQVVVPTTRPPASQVSAYNVAPDLPKYIAIPAAKLGQTRILALGLTHDNFIATPTSVYDAGWYNASAKPGQAGAMFIFAHVAFGSTKGAFYDLSKLKSGDSIIVTRGDNKVYNYQVATTKVYPVAAVDMSAVLTPIKSGQPGLNLMTCTGLIDQKTGNYTERLVIFANQDKY